jgi:regulator of replication initiation timing
MRRSRDIQIFSLSLLDMFACAMGAFMLLSFVLMPYFQRKNILEEQIDTLDAKLALAHQENQTLQLDNERLKGQNQELAGALKKAVADADALTDSVTKLRAELVNARQIAFLGIHTKATDLVVLFDMSKSILDAGYEEIMLRTLDAMVEIVDENYRVQFIGFQGRTPEFTEWAPSGELFTMSDAKKREAHAWIRDLKGKWRGDTPTREALLRALDHADAGAVFLLTDGTPTEPDGKDSSPAQRAAIIADVTRRNAGRMEIHTVAIGKYDSVADLEQFLIKLAKENRGQFLGVSR